MGILLFLGAVAQEPVLYNYKSGNGLPSNEVYNMLPDRQGYMWFATDRGPARFDGSRFVTYSVNDGVGDNFVDRVIQSPGGAVWIIANGRDLYRFDGTRFIAYRYNAQLRALVGSHSMAWLMQVGFRGEEPLVFGIRGYGLVRMTAEGKLVLAPAAYVHQQLAYDTAYGIAYYMDTVGRRSVQKAGATFQFLGKTYPAQTTKTTNCIRRRNGDLLIAYDRYLFSLHNGYVTHTAEYDNIVISLYADREDRLWVCTYGNGARMYAPGQAPGAVEPELYFTDTRVSGVTQDREGGYWFSSQDKGVLYVPSLNMRLLDNPVLAPNEYFQEIGAGDPHAVYAVTSRGRIFRSIDGGPLAFYRQAYRTSLTTVCNDIVYDSLTHNLYCCFSEKIYAINTATGLSVTYPVSSRTVLPRDDSFYTLTQTGIIYDVHRRLGLKIINTLGNFSGIINPDKSIFAGTDKGLLILKDTVLRPFAAGMVRQRVTAIRRLDDGSLVASTLGQGLVLIRGSTVRLLPLGNGNPVNMVNDIVLDHDTVWAATEAGVARIVLAGKDPVIRLMMVDDRFLQNNTRKIACAAGFTYVLAQNKLIVFPGRVVADNIAPPVFMERVLVGDSLECNPAETYAFRHTDRRIRFMFSGIGFKAGRLIRYQYRLNGLHTDWYTTEQPFVEYPSLQPGNYTFEVAAVNECGIVSVQNASYTFTIPAPFWKKAWFMLLMAVLVGLMAWLIIRIRVKQLQQRDREKELLLAKEQVALSAQINPHFLFNSLNSIQHLIMQEDKKNAVMYMAQFSRLMRLSLDNSRKKWVPAGNEMELLKLYLELESLRFKGKFLYHVHVDEVLLSGKLLIPAMLIQPFVENAVRHGVNNLPGEDGLITVTLQLDGQKLVATIEDNGVGRARSAQLRDKTAVHQSAGMEITEERLRLLCRETGVEWSFMITDKTGADGRPAGTTVQFIMPFIKSTQTY